MYYTAYLRHKNHEVYSIIAYIKAKNVEDARNKIKDFALSPDDIIDFMKMPLSAHDITLGTSGGIYAKDIAEISIHLDENNDWRYEDNEFYKHISEKESKEVDELIMY